MPRGSRLHRLDPMWTVRVRPVRVLVVTAGIVAIFALTSPYWLTRWGAWTVRADTTDHADIAVLLAGGEGERLGIGMRLWREGRVDAILILDPGTRILPVYTAGESLSMADVKQRIAVRKGIPADRIVTAVGSTSTYEEAVLVKPLLLQRGVRSAVIVTSPYHSRRARATFLRVFRDTPIRITLETLPAEARKEWVDRWWTREGGLVGVFQETLKSLFYWRRFGIPLG